MQKRDWKSALYNYLLAYRVSPNMSTKVPPALLLNNKIPRTKIPTTDKIIKDKMKKYFDNRYHTKNCQMHIGDCILVRQPRLNKLTPRSIPILIFF